MSIVPRQHGKGVVPHMSALWAWIVLAAVVATSVIIVEGGRRLLAGGCRRAGPAPDASPGAAPRRRSPSRRW
ncbi:hypothetical protein LUX57_06015 [Actinomadura madurae]|uniref:hypothetical protein n=1 Tax=Actinomadura madurae TaxID=1993 RepID=UPI0020D22B5B|nr:hypothetical protein [Actinomadura madurae]MCP9964753.1 hypothetical protein [Actinomadura madurae]